MVLMICETFEGHSRAPKKLASQLPERTIDE
jgi:hypothetical protein